MSSNQGLPNNFPLQIKSSLAPRPAPGALPVPSGPSVPTPRIPMQYPPQPMPSNRVQDRPHASVSPANENKPPQSSLSHNPISNSAQRPYRPQYSRPINPSPTNQIYQSTQSTPPIPSGRSSPQTGFTGPIRPNPTIAKPHLQSQQPPGATHRPPESGHSKVRALDSFPVDISLICIAKGIPEPIVHTAFFE